jgi:hypothetical protein
MRNYPNWDIGLTSTGTDRSYLLERGKLFATWLSKLPLDVQYVMRIEPKFKPKSNEQMAWYRGKVLLECLSMINSGLPMEERITKRELDAFFSKEFLTVNRGTEYEGVLSKGNLSTKEFSQLTNNGNENERVRMP